MTYSQQISAMLSRYCEPTGHANARPMTGYAKQSTKRSEPDGEGMMFLIFRNKA
jgi:hypothetical protein